MYEYLITSQLKSTCMEMVRPFVIYLYKARSLFYYLAKKPASEKPRIEKLCRMRFQPVYLYFRALFSEK